MIGGCSSLKHAEQFSAHSPWRHSPGSSVFFFSVSWSCLHHARCGPICFPWKAHSCDLKSAMLYADSLGCLLLRFDMHSATQYGTFVGRVPRSLYAQELPGTAPALSWALEPAFIKSALATFQSAFFGFSCLQHFFEVATWDIYGLWKC